ncbi:MAG: hypothetical protein AAF108_09700 [Planctomycetota bacterium]
MNGIDPSELNDETITRFDRDIKALLKRYPRCVVAAALFPSSAESSDTSRFDPFGEWGSPTGIYGTNQMEGDAEAMASMSAYLQVLALRAMHQEAQRSPVGREAFLDMARVHREHMVAELVRQMRAEGEDAAC